MTELKDPQIQLNTLQKFYISISDGLGREVLTILYNKGNNSITIFTKGLKGFTLKCHKKSCYIHGKVFQYNSKQKNYENSL